MKKKWSLICALLLCLLFCSIAAADGAEIDGEITGTCEGFDYVLPYLKTGTDADESINQWLSGQAEQELVKLFPQLVLSENKAQVKYDIARNDERYLCVVLSAETEEGVVGRKAISFARDGIYAGRPINLTQVLGLESEVEPQALDNTILALIWESVQRAAENMDRGFLDGLTLESVASALDPQWDFRLDENGNIVFLIQPGEVAAEMEGVLEYPFLPEELIDAMK